VAISLLTRSLAAGLAFRRPAVAAAASSTRYQELKRYAVPEARQAVAVDSDCFYAIGNSSIARYSKESGVRIAGWECLRSAGTASIGSAIPGRPTLALVVIVATRSIRCTWLKEWCDGARSGLACSGTGECPLWD
jgi:hypothetical protein